MLCQRCGASAEEGALFCRHCGLNFGPKDLKPEQRGKLKLCPSCVVRLDIEKVLSEPTDREEQGGWFQVITLDDSCELCRRAENIKFPREHLAELLPHGLRPVAPECWCGLVYFFPDRGKAVPVPKRREVHLADLKRKEDGTYDLSGLSKSQIADLLWEEAAGEAEKE